MTKTALITGASSGLGYEFVKLFAKDGYNLVLVARNEKKLNEIKQTFNNINITIIKKDLSLKGASKEIYEELKTEGISIDVLVNNAGFGLLGSFDELSVEKQTEMINLNISTLTQMTHYFLPEMKRKGSGKILNVASLAAFLPVPMMAVYAATKAYVLSFSEALNEELNGRNISVTALCPGATKTNFGSVANAAETKVFKEAMEAEVVAKQAYKALLSGKSTVITGSLNKASALGVKFLPRKAVPKISKRMATKK
ncbi:short-chain dehydrogenase [Lottiidibacillus patelloidae]|uniref:Short-chain dehydrogenase n=1 Tax=Lottiidibacillus patelloidae TaxID=2670334 RepID=A0A263BWB8_9BACI|nr:SDR family oxidoreductase [Lottiidibacillus patelloidae]OZM58041.1 short-chain dehydrogenase [Lottiidibacillus patelloidae]